MKNEDSQHPFNERIIWKYFDGTATSEEEQELSQWLATSEKHRREVAELRAVRQRFAKWRSTLYGPARFIRSLNRLNSRIDALENAPCTVQRPHRLSNLFGHIRIHSLLRTAAVVAVVALTGMFAWRTALMPAPITYFNADTTIMHVAMPDGSDIWLTPGSTLCYDETFPTDERRVHLDGEAYFDVSRDPRKPFVVHTERQRIRVLGTSFNVMAYDGDTFNIVTLLSGAVQLDVLGTEGSLLESVRMKPFEQCRFDTRTGELTATLLSDEDRNRTWTDGVFRFRDEPLSMIVSRLEKYYGIEIAVDDSLGSVRYTGAFPLEQKITEVLETLNFEKRFTVVQHGNDFALEKK